jgi:hypothetical protein
MEWAQEAAADRPNATFYFPSLGMPNDGVFLDGAPEKQTLPAEWLGLALTLLGVILLTIMGRFNFQGNAPRGLKGVQQGGAQP